MMNAIDAMHRVVDRPRTLRVQAEYSGPESAVIAVEDLGPGIDAKDRDRIFDAFFTTKSSGLGLGLAICRSIAEFAWWPVVGLAQCAPWHDFPRQIALSACEPGMREDSTPTVLVIDDDASVREALANLFTSVGLQVEAFASPTEFLEQEDLRPRPDALSWTSGYPGAADWICRLSLLKPTFVSRLSFVSGHGDIPMTVRAMKAGAVEFLTKPLHDQQLLDAVHRALDLDRAWRNEQHSISELLARFETLTDREQHVIRLVIGGQLNKQIAHTLGLSEITVKVHRANAMRKMGAGSLTELMKIAHALKLGTDDA